MARPKFFECPGIVVRRAANGWRALWLPRNDLRARGYKVKAMTVWRGHEPTETDRKYASDVCRRLHAEQVAWARGGHTELSQVTGPLTLKVLIRCFQHDPDSSYRTIEYQTRVNYDRYCARIETDHGTELAADINARLLKRWHEGWSAGGKVAMGHGLIGMLRTLTTFGATILEDAECKRLKDLLRDMRFAMPKARESAITVEQVTAVRTKAREMGLASVALAQAFQFECTFRQKDVIGAWVPLEEPGISDVTTETDKWVKGITWQEIDDNLILRHVTSKRKKKVEIDLKNAPMVMEELGKLGERPRTGPVIVSEKTNRPYLSQQFRAAWRRVARAAGIPDAVYNMDTRAGAITEAFEAGADKESVRKSATHSNAQMTEKYSRADQKAIASVMQLRAAGRNKNGT